MRVIIFATVALLVASGYAAPPVISHYETHRQVEVRGIFEDIINSTVNDALADLPESIDVDDIPVDFGDSETLSGDIDVSQLHIDGLKGLVASFIQLDLASMHLQLTLNLHELLISFKYNADMLLLQLVPLYGNGRITLSFDDVVIFVDGTADLDDGISVSDLTVKIELAGASFDLEGLINNPEFSSIISNALNDNFVDFVDDNEDLISRIISPIIQSAANSILNNGDSASAQLAQVNAPQLISEYKGEQ